jgi:hypothetical protein
MCEKKGLASWGQSVSCVGHFSQFDVIKEENCFRLRWKIREKDAERVQVLCVLQPEMTHTEFCALCDFLYYGYHNELYKRARQEQKLARQKRAAEPEEEGARRKHRPVIDDDSDEEDERILAQARDELKANDTLRSYNVEPLQDDCFLSRQAMRAKPTACNKLLCFLPYLDALKKCLARDDQALCIDMGKPGEYKQSDVQPTYCCLVPRRSSEQTGYRLRLFPYGIMWYVPRFKPTLAEAVEDKSTHEPAHSLLKDVFASAAFRDLVIKQLKHASALMFKNMNGSICVIKCNGGVRLDDIGEARYYLAEHLLCVQPGVSCAYLSHRAAYTSNDDHKLPVQADVADVVTNLANKHYYLRVVVDADDWKSQQKSDRDKVVKFKRLYEERIADDKHTFLGRVRNIRELLQKVRTNVPMPFSHDQVFQNIEARLNEVIVNNEQEWSNAKLQHAMGSLYHMAQYLGPHSQPRRRFDAFESLLSSRYRMLLHKVKQTPLLCAEILDDFLRARLNERELMGAEDAHIDKWSMAVLLMQFYMYMGYDARVRRRIYAWLGAHDQSTLMLWVLLRATECDANE